MATYWVDPTKADDTDDGSTLALAKKTINAGLALLSAKGDILNLVNTGDHVWQRTADMAEVNISSGIGTSWTDYGYLIRGRSADGSAANMVSVVASTSTGARTMVRFINGSGWNILENILFDATALPTDAAEYNAVRWSGTTVGPVKFRYCALLGAATGVFPSGNRKLFESVGALLPAGEGLYLEYVYFQNVKFPLAGPYGSTETQLSMQRCVGILDINGRTQAWFDVGNWGNAPNNVVSFLNNTFYESVGNNDSPDVFNYAPSPSVDVGIVNCYNNFVWRDTTDNTNSLFPFMGGGVAATAVTHTGTIGPNVLLGGPNTDGTELLTGGLYELPWDANDDDSTDPDTWPADTVAYGEADTDVFNDPASTYDWVMPNGLTIAILKDLRPIKYSQAGLYGSTPGALPAYEEPEPPDDERTDYVPYIDTRALYGDDLEMRFNGSIALVRNRVTRAYKRNDKEGEYWREYKSETRILATNTEARIYSGIETVRNIAVYAPTNPVQVSISPTETEDRYWPSTDFMAMTDFVGKIVKVKNPSTTDTAEVITVKVD